ncbi:Ada metal-binding domain-containing protein [Pseudomonas sp. R4-39-08]|uniref:Ada metal-binding domain-containing protein n=1 Tax=Pseudomonas sp. R4-39-08 TaxID=1173288 RepID=UPI00273F378F|nr:Ada metal-binding domain-containing protein [Pseudomonas sp. R4-39-08]
MTAPDGGGCVMRRWKVMDSHGKPALSSKPGQFVGHKGSKIYGRLDCPAALRALSKGGYVKDRVFFIDEQTARLAGYRPCFRCMPASYREWKLTIEGHIRGRVITEECEP